LGLSIAAAMTQLESVAELTDEHLNRIVGDGTALARRHQQLKAFIAVFGSNTPLHNPKLKGQRPGAAHVERYAALLVRIRDSMGQEATNIPCEVCGAPRSLNVHQLKDSTGKTPSFKCFVARCSPTRRFGSCPQAGHRGSFHPRSTPQKPVTTGDSGDKPVFMRVVTPCHRIARSFPKR
jgi:hypothetical protein